MEHRQRRGGGPGGRRAVGGGIVFAVGVSLAAACGSGGTTTADTPATGTDRGAQVYAAKCAECHGADLEGTAKGPSHLSRVYEPGHHGDASFRRAIKQGAPQHHWSFGPMAPVAGVSDADADAVIAFIRQEQNRRGLKD